MLILVAARAPNDVRLLPQDARIAVRADLVLKVERAIMSPKPADKRNLHPVKPNDPVFTQEVTLLYLSTGEQLAVMESLDEVLELRYKAVQDTCGDEYSHAAQSPGVGTVNDLFTGTVEEGVPA